MGGTHSHDELEGARSRSPEVRGSVDVLAAVSPLAAALPHRAYRRIEPENRWVMLLTILVIAVIQYFVFINFHQIMLTMCEWTRTLLSWLNVGNLGQSFGYDNYMWVRLYPPVYDIKEWTWQQYGIGTLIGIILIVVFVLFRRLIAPIRLTILTIILLLTFGSLYMTIYRLLGFGIGFDGFELSRLYIRAVLLTWAFMPIGFALLSLVIPFNPIERLLVVFLPVLYDFPFTVVRFALMIWITNVAGGVPAAPFFLLFGSAVTFIFYVCVFSLMLNRVALRVQGGGRREARWRW